MPLDLRLSYRQPSARSRVLVRPGLLARAGRLIADEAESPRVLLVTDRTVARLHGRAFARTLTREGLKVATHVVPAGERSKRPDRLVALWDDCAEAGIGRRDRIVALGGGVVGDLAGFAAATWLRGIPWVCVPTTLLAQVDASIGGKTAVDLDAGKNLAGAFHQPDQVLVDPDVLRTLPVRHRRAGLAEVVKIAIAADASLFQWCERNADRLAAGDPRALETAIVRSLSLKARIVQRDEREREGGARTALNLGHTLAHAYEAARGYRGILHGEAVAVGLRFAAALAVQAAGLPAREAARIDALLDRLELPRRMRGASRAALMRAMQQDKKRGAHALRWVLTTKIGHASVPRPLDTRLIVRTLNEFGAQT